MLGETVAATNFMVNVKEELFEQVSALMCGMSKHERADADVSSPIPSKQRDRLVNGCKFTSSLLQLGLCTLADVRRLLAHLGAVNNVRFQESATSTTIHKPE